MSRTANPHIHRLSENRGGRDFVVGDLHGCLPAFQQLLEATRFNPSRDRILCVGDLTHRGPDSLGCIQLLQEPWFHCVRGNHEENTISALNTHFGMPTANTDAFYQLAKDGGLWLCELIAKSFLKAPEAKLVSQALSDALFSIQSLPKILIVGEGKSRYHLVHAALLKNENLRPDHPDFAKKCLLSAEELDRIAAGEIPLENPRLLNGSKWLGAHIKAGEKQGVTSPLNQPPTFCGHTPLKHPASFLNHYHLDTGAGKPDKPNLERKLTAIHVGSGQIYQTPAGQPEPKIEPRDYARKIGKALTKGKEIPPLQ